MKKINSDAIIYSLNVKDVQNVALEEIGRELSQIEIESIIDTIASNISWYDAIANSIHTELKVKEPL